MARLAAFVLHHRRWVMLFWLVMFIVGVGASGKATDRLTVDFSLPGQPGYETSVKILAQYGNGAAYQPYIPVVTVPAGTTVQAEQAKISAVFDEIQQAVPGVRVVDYAQTKDAVFLTKDGRTTYALVYAPPPKGFTGATPDQAIQPILDKAAASDGFAWSITGYDILSRGTGGGSTGPSVLFETALGALGALAVLLFVFASFLALVPLLIAAVSILSTFTVVLLLTYVTDMSFIVQFLIALVGLGVAVDYSLLFVTRWREERDHGRTNEESVTIAMTTAGRGGRLERRHRGHQPDLAAGPARAVPAQHGAGRHAHPGGEHVRRAHPAARAAGRDRPARRLAEDPARDQRLAWRGPAGHG
jgi:RND superfamily putative drug exporter